MAKPAFTLDVNGVQLVDKLLEQVIAGTGNMKPFFPEAVKKWDEIQQEWFKSRGRGSWVPLSPAYAAWKARHFPGRPLLVLRGNLRDSPFKTVMDNATVSIEADAPFYWIFHQEGTSKMPARPPYVIDEEMQESISQAVVDGLVGYMSGL